MKFLSLLLHLCIHIALSSRMMHENALEPILRNIGKSQDGCKRNRLCALAKGLKTRLIGSTRHGDNTSKTTPHSQRSPLVSQSRWHNRFTSLFHKPPPKKLLILMSDTGGGHRASAQALDQAIQQQFPHKIEVEIMDLWTVHGKWPFTTFVPAYRFLAKHPLLWKAFYAYGTFPLTRRLTEIVSSSVCYKGFEKAIVNAKADMIVSVHPLCQHIPLTIIGRMPKRIPFITIVTDLASAHTTWFDNRVDALIVPNGVMRDIAVRRGVAKHKVIVRGLPVRPPFWHRSLLPRSVLRHSLGLYNRDTVLVMGGGDGVGQLHSIASDLISSMPTLEKPCQLVVVCGKNKKTRERLVNMLDNDPTVMRSSGGEGSSINRGGYPGTTTSTSSDRGGASDATTSNANAKGNASVDARGRCRPTMGMLEREGIYRAGVIHHEIPLYTPTPTTSATSTTSSSIRHYDKSKLHIIVLGFVSDIHKYMLSSDLLITKAGPGSIAEAMCCGLPILISSFLPGQEWGNVNYVTSDIQCGLYPRRSDLPHTVLDLLSRHRSRLSKMRDNALLHAQPMATLNIARDIGLTLLELDKEM